MALPEVMARLQLIPGIGPWTAAETLQRVLGAADALTLGDLHLPSPGPRAVRMNRCWKWWSHMPDNGTAPPGSSCSAGDCQTGGPAGHRTAASLIYDTTVRCGDRQRAGQTVPRQPPVSAPRDSMNCLKRFRSPVAWRLTKPSLSPTVSARPSGAWSSCSMILVVLSSM